MKQDRFLRYAGISWRQAWSSKSFRVQQVAVILAIAGLAAGTPHFFDFIEQRSGPRLADPLLDMLPNRNVSWLVFFILYSGVVLGLYDNARKPMLLLLSFQTYIFVMLMRFTTLSLLPLEPPLGYVPLREPIVQMFFTSDHRIISKDLFFSGHMSTLLCLAFTVVKSPVRFALVLFSIILAVLLLIQHVHYTVDIVAAPVGTWLSYRLARRITGSINL